VDGGRVKAVTRCGAGVGALEIGILSQHVARDTHADERSHRHDGLLLDTELNDEQRDYVETVRSSSDSLLTIINDISTSRRSRRASCSLRRWTLTLEALLSHPSRCWAERAQAKGVEVVAFVEDNLPTHVRGDAGRLRQVLVNLVGNAVKFTDTGEVIVRATKEHENGYVIARFEITDTGIGLSKEAQRYLFQPFVQADGSTTRKYGGTGLGLAISRQLVELMGGTIGVEKRAGQGFDLLVHGAA
jgi:signal transduction histidine kinase